MKPYVIVESEVTAALIVSNEARLIVARDTARSVLAARPEQPAPRARLLRVAIVIDARSAENLSSQVRVGVVRDRSVLEC